MKRKIAAAILVAATALGLGAMAASAATSHAGTTASTQTFYRG